MNEEKKSKRSNSGRKKLPEGEKKVNLPVNAKIKNHEKILEKIVPIIKKMDI